MFSRVNVLSGCLRVCNFANTVIFSPKVLVLGMIGWGRSWIVERVLQKTFLVFTFLLLFQDGWKGGCELFQMILIHPTKTVI